MFIFTFVHLGQDMIVSDAKAVPVPIAAFGLSFFFPWGNCGSSPFSLVTGRVLLAPLVKIAIISGLLQQFTVVDIVYL
jgi:hypothetical protein